MNSGLSQRGPQILNFPRENENNKNWKKARDLMQHLISEANFICHIGKVKKTKTSSDFINVCTLMLLRLFIRFDS